MLKPGDFFAILQKNGKTGCFIHRQTIREGLAGGGIQTGQLIFFFSFHSALAELGRSYGWTGADRLLMVRNVSIGVSAPCWLAEWMESEFLIALLIVSFVSLLLLWMYLFNLSKYFRDKT